MVNMIILLRSCFQCQLLGVMRSLLGALFDQLNLYKSYWRINHVQKRVNQVKIIETCLVSLIISFMSFGLPLRRKWSPCPGTDSNLGRDCPRPTKMYGSNTNFYCSKEKEYNGLATIFCNPQDDASRNLLSLESIHGFSAQGLLIFLLFLLCLCLSYNDFWWLWLEKVCCHHSS